MEMSMYILCAC